MDQQESMPDELREEIAKQLLQQFRESENPYTEELNQYIDTATNLIQPLREQCEQKIAQYIRQLEQEYIKQIAQLAKSNS